MACRPEDRAQSEPQRQQVETRLAERHHNLHPRAHVALQFPQPQDVNRAHSLSSSRCFHEFLYNLPSSRLEQREVERHAFLSSRTLHRRHIFATWRIAALASAPSSRSDEPVSARNAASSDSVPVFSFSCVEVPWATMLPWSMMAMRWATRSASSM